jgi:ClpP class serine protease
MTSLQTALIRLGSRPLAIAPRALEALLAAGHVAPAPRSSGTTLGRGYAVTDAGIAVVPVLGPLVARGDSLTELFGASVYGELGEAIEAALIDPAVRGVVMEIDSPGGKVAGMFDLVDRLVSLRATAGKPLWAVASESETSAAYAIASAAEHIYVTRTGEVGSIGIVAAHLDQSSADAKAGLAWTFIHAGAHKLDGNPHQPLSDPARAAIQADVDALRRIGRPGRAQPQPGAGDGARHRGGDLPRPRRCCDRSRRSHRHRRDRARRHECCLRTAAVPAQCHH